MSASSSTDTHCQCCGLSDPFASWSDSATAKPLWNTSLTFAPNEVSGGNANIADLHEVVQGLESAIHVLQAKKAHAEARLAEQISYLAPIQRLPDDILLIVMKIACGVNDFPAGHHFHAEIQTYPAVVPQKRVLPWTVAAVSRRWRAVSLSIPHLWARIEHVVSDQEDFNPVHVALQLERSKGQPLIVRVEMESERSFHGLMNGALQSHVHRIQEFDVDLNRYTENLPRPLNMASLQRLRLSHNPFPDPGARLAFKDAPLLKHLFLHNLQLQPSTQTLISPNSWTTLTSLQLEDFQLSSPSHLIELLRLARNLSLLKLVPDMSDPDSMVSLDVQFDVVQLPRLKFFHMCFANDDRLSRKVIQLIRAPSVSYLQLSSVGPDDLSAIAAFVGLASSAQSGGTCQITTLSIRNPYQRQEPFGPHLVALLGKLQSLRYLQSHRRKPYLYVQIGLDSLLLSLARSPANHETQWSPHLEELHVGCANDNTPLSLSLSSLRSFCNSRRSEGGVFRTVFVSEGSLPALEGAQEDVDDEALRQWGTEAHQSGLLKYPAPAGSWVDIF